MEERAAVKAAKKALKRHDSTEMKLKELAKKVVATTSNENTPSYKQVKKWIQASQKFTVNGKVVSLNSSSKKRAASPKDLTKEEMKKSSKKMKRSHSAGDDSSSVSQWREENLIVLKPASSDKSDDELNQRSEFFPFTTFDAPGCVQHIAAPLLRQCTQGNGFTKPSPIQSQAWPILTSKSGQRYRDVVGIAETGSGKTLAFCLPALSRMSKTTTTTRNGRLPRMLVLAPTRELAMQSNEVLVEFGAVVSLSSMVAYGGVPKHTQTIPLKKGVDCVVATPGRLVDLVQEGSCDLSAVEYLVLDEADRMLDMGFEEDVRYIISNCQSKENGRQTAMFSATWPTEIQSIAAEFMVDPVRIYVGFESSSSSNTGSGDENGNTIDDSLSANKRVKQTVEVIDDRAREARLRQILNKVHGKQQNRVLVFGLYKKEAERLEYSLKRDGWNCCSIHGNKSQPARTEALKSFKDGTLPLMVATDVAARGLDIPNVEYVINYTFPLTIEDYIHRIGRTGRAGKHGESYTFFQPTDKAQAGALQAVIRQAGQEVPKELLKFGSTIKRKEHKLYGNFGPKGPMKAPTKITFTRD